MPLARISNPATVALYAEVAQMRPLYVTTLLRIERADQKIHNPKSQAEFWQGIGERSDAIQGYVKCLERI